MDEREHIEYHAMNNEAWKAHMERMRKNDVIGEDYRFTCAIAPGDYVTVRRYGSKGLDSSYANLFLTIHGEVYSVMLNAANARRLAGALLNIADELDPYIKGNAPDDKVGGEK